MKDNDENDSVSSQYYAAKESLDVMVMSLDGGNRRTMNNPVSQEQDMTEQEAVAPQTWREKLSHYYEKEGLLIEVLVAIVLARIYPRLGAEYLFPEVTAHWIAVILIFCKSSRRIVCAADTKCTACFVFNSICTVSDFIISYTLTVLSGFALKVEQLSEAASNWKFNIIVMSYNFIGVSFVVNFVAKFFYRNEIVSEDLMKGMIICSCLSMPTNMMVVLAIASKGDDAVALFLATLMNLLGVFVTPVLILFYLQENAEIDFVKTYTTISFRVLLPVAIGILLRVKLEGADEFAMEKKSLFLKIRERCLVYVVYATFCKTFIDESDSTASQILIMAVSQIILLSSFLAIAWLMLFICFNRQPKLRVVGLYGCCMKTAALGIPLISAIYEDHPKLGIYTLPLLVWYPSQLIICTMLAPRMANFVDYKLNKYEMERSTRKFDVNKGCGLLPTPSWV